MGALCGGSTGLDHDPTPTPTPRGNAPFQNPDPDTQPDPEPNVCRMLSSAELLTLAEAATLSLYQTPSLI